MVAAMRVSAAGWSAAVIDFRPFGGTCALRGCDPKKMLIGGAEAADHARRMRSKGIAGEIGLDWKALMGFKRGFTDPVPEKMGKRYADKGIDTFHGHARFTGPQLLLVGEERLEARHVLIAAGAEPVKLGIPGEEHLVDNEGFLATESLPRRIVLVGGGYIAAEFSHVAARAGAEVTILQQGKRMLKHFDADLVGWLMESFQRIGVEVRTGATVQRVEKMASGLRVHAQSSDSSSAVEADVVVHAAGRRPALDELDLSAGGVETENGRLKLNEYLQSTSNPAVYAAGDAAQVGPPLTPVSSHDARIVAANLLEGNRHKPDYRGVPSVAFTIPPIAAVGLSEEQARSRSLKFRVNSAKASDWFTARQAAEPVYGFKVLIEEKTDQVLGAHLVGPHADEVINIFAFAIRQRLPAEAMRTTMFAYPTGASDIGYML